MSNMSWSFAGRTVVITGANRGIGLATATLFAGAGADVFSLSRSTPPAGSDGITHIVCDVGDDGAVQAAIGEVATASGRVDVCVANAGVCQVEDFSEADPRDWAGLLDTNLLGVMRVWQAALRHIGVDGAPGRLIANASAAGVRGEAPIPAYCASKAAIAGLVQALAIRYAGRGITVNAVAPGEIDTDMNRDARARVAAASGRSSGDVLEELVEEHIPVRRLGEAPEVAALIAYLASDEAAYVTGQMLLIDGGQLLV